MPAVSQADGERPHTGHAPAADVLTAERAYLLQSREFLHLMREDVLSLKALGGDPISEEYLKAELYHRAEALKDLPGTPLFFGRLDYRATRRPARTGRSALTRRSAPAGRPAPAGGSTLTSRAARAALTSRAARACRAARPSTSAGVTCTTPAVIPSSSTGGPRCPGPSTAPAGPSRWASRCAGGSASPAGS